MNAQLVEQARERLAELRREQIEQFFVGACAVVTSLVLTTVYTTLVLPLFVGGFAVLMLGIRSLWRHWDLVDRLAEDPSMHAIPEVAEYARRHGHHDAGAH
jgi:hypothetical protein